MSCVHPLSGYKSRSGNGQIVFSVKEGWVDKKIIVACGQCVGCRLERSRQWAFRCMHEASLYDDNSFITLTYNNENIPKNGSLNKKDFQDFIKRLRKKIYPKKVRYYHCGEYGLMLSRPHYHAILFGYQFSDLRIFNDIGKNITYTSSLLESLWTCGYSIIGDCNYDTASYVAGYIMKKITGNQAKEHYARVDPITGEIYYLEPEYSTMSRRPGIGKGWYDKYKSDVYPSDEVIVKGYPSQPPRFYDNELKKEDIEEFEELKKERARRMADAKRDDSFEKNEVREIIINKKISLFKKRNYENDK